MLCEVKHIQKKRFCYWLNGYICYTYHICNVKVQAMKKCPIIGFKTPIENNIKCFLVDNSDDTVQNI